MCVCVCVCVLCVEEKIRNRFHSSLLFSSQDMEFEDEEDIPADEFENGDEEDAEEDEDEDEEDKTIAHRNGGCNYT